MIGRRRKIQSFGSRGNCLCRAALGLFDHFDVRANRKYPQRGAFACRNFPSRRHLPHIFTLVTENSTADKLSFQFDAELPLVLVEHFITFDIKCRKIIINVFDKALIYRCQRFFPPLWPLITFNLVARIAESASTFSELKTDSLCLRRCVHFSSATQPKKGNDLRNCCRLRAIKHLLLGERDKEANQTKRTAVGAAGRSLKVRCVPKKERRSPRTALLTMKLCVRGPNTSRHGQRFEPLRKTIPNGVRSVFTCAWSTWHSVSD